MPLSAPIPPDVIRIILGNLKGNKATLKKTALVSSVFLEPSQAHLFASVSLILNYTRVIKKKPIFRLLSAFNSNPNLASHVREFTLQVHDDWVVQDEYPHISDSIIVPVLRMIKRLKSFTLSIMWEYQTDALISAIVDMCRTKSLSCLHLFHCRSFPMVELSYLHQLRHLSIYGAGSSDFDDYEIEHLQNKIEAPHGCCLEVLELNVNGMPLGPYYLYKTLVHPCSSMNLSKLRILKIGSTTQACTEEVWKIVLLAASTLEGLQWSLLDMNDWEDSSRTLVDLALLSGLRILSLSFILTLPHEEYISSWVLESLERMAGCNVLECFALAPHWTFAKAEAEPMMETFLQQLDLLLTGGGFPCLDKLKISVVHGWGESERLELVLRSFPRSEAAGILSVYKISWPGTSDVDLMLKHLKI